MEFQHLTLPVKHVYRQKKTETTIFGSETIEDQVVDMSVYNTMYTQWTVVTNSSSYTYSYNASFTELYVDDDTCASTNFYAGTVTQQSQGEQTGGYSYNNGGPCPYGQDAWYGSQILNDSISYSSVTLMSTNESGVISTNTYDEPGWINQSYGESCVHYTGSICDNIYEPTWLCSTNSSTEWHHLQIIIVDGTQTVQPQQITIDGGSSTTGTSTNNAETTYVLENEFLTEDVIGLAVARLSAQIYPDQSEWPAGFPGASSSLSEDETAAGVSKSKYYWELQTETNKNYFITFTCRVTGPDNFYLESSETRTYKGNGGFISGDGELEAEPEGSTVKYHAIPVGDMTAPQNSSASMEITYETEEVDSDSDCTSCSDQDDSSPGGRGPSLSSVLLNFGLGRTIEGARVGKLHLKQDMPSWSLSSPQLLKLIAAPEDVEIVTNIPNAYIQQVRAPQCLVDIQVINSNKYTLGFYSRSAFTPVTNSLGVFPTNNDPYVLWTIENPDGSTASNRLQVVETRGWTHTTNLFTWDHPSQTWSFLSGNGLRKETVSYSWNTEHSLRTETRKTINPNNEQVLFIKTEKYERFAWGEGIVEKVIGTGDNAQTNTFSYYSNGKLHVAIHGDGSWERYEYDALGRTTKISSGRENESPATNPSIAVCKVRRFGYTPCDSSGDDGTLYPMSPREEFEDNGGTIFAKFSIYTANETRELRVNPGMTCSSEGALTVTEKFTSGPNLSRIKKITHPDETISLFEYSFSANGRTNIVYRGEPNSGGTAVIDGTKTITVFGVYGELLSVTNMDVASGIVIDGKGFSNHDEFNRPGRVDYLDGTFEEKQYSCCGLEHERNRDGIETFRYRDSLKRQIASLNNGILLTNALDAAGNILATTRIGTNGSAIQLSARVYDDAGRLITETNAAGQATFFSEVLNVDKQLVRTTTYPNGGTRIETYYREGSLQKVTGTAVHPVRYERLYGLTTKEVKLAANGSDTAEWFSTTIDVDGYKTQIAYPNTTSEDWEYLNFTQLKKHKDPDWVTTLYDYNAKGEMEFTVTDMNQNDIIDFDGIDRISRIVRDVTTSHGAHVRRTRHYDWPTDYVDSSILVSTEEVSTDGLRSWRISPAGTNSTEIVREANGDRYVTKTAPDGSFTVSSYENGRLNSIVRKDALGNQLSAITYTYDAHGQLKHTMDARNGTTFYTYDDSDRVVSIERPAPAPGQSSQVTSNLFDNMGRIWKTILPDSTAVTNEYYLTGELKKTSGSRTYPVEYTYDSQGRMKTMKTWQNFSTDSGAAVTTWNYDPDRGFLASKEYADANGPSYEYTDAGRLAKRTWARGVWTDYYYDTAGAISGAYGSDATTSVTYWFDRLGRIDYCYSGNDQTVYDYNDAGQIRSETYSSGLLAGLGITNQFDQFLRRTNLIAFENSTAYGYDAASRLKTVSNGSDSVTYAYLANSRMVESLTFKENNVTKMATTRRYDYLNRITNIASVVSNNVISSFAYQYNSANQRIRVDTADGSYWIYQYDALGQVISGKKYWSDATPVAGQQFEYGFDDIGNRTSSAAGGNEDGDQLRSATYTANSLNQYSQRTVPASFDVVGSAKTNAMVTVNNGLAYRKGDYFRAELTVDNAASPVYASVASRAVVYDSGADVIATKEGKTFVPKTPEQFTYDDDGNLTDDGRWTYSWDAENRLIAVESHATDPAESKRKLEFSYDFRGRRIGRKVYEEWNAGSSSYTQISETRFLYEGWNLVAEVDESSQPIRLYFWGTDLSGSTQGAGGVGGLLAVIESANTHFTAFDGNGNLAKLVNSSDCSVSATYEYGPFGEPLRVEGSVAEANPFRFSTKYTDGESGLVYFGHRYYNANTGGWLNRDPINERGGLNLYNFVGNHPLHEIDHLGLRWVNDGFGERYWEEEEDPDNFTRNQIQAQVAELDSQINDIACCCSSGSSRMEVDLRGVPNGSTISVTATITRRGCAYAIEKYYWWNCFHAQDEGSAWWDVYFGSNPDAWQDFGYYPGGLTDTQTHEGQAESGRFDSNHWGWRLFVIYTYCGKDGYLHAGSAEGANQWTWNDETKSWQ